MLLTLSGDVANGDAVTVAYTKPSSNPLQTSAGGQAASFSAKSVTNNVAAPVPAYVSSSVENATPSRIDITFSLSLANIIPAASAFTVMVNSTARTVSSVAISGTKVLLTLSGAVAYGDAVTVAYSKPSSNPLQTTAGGQAASFSAKSVTINVAAPVPAYVSSSIENATPSRLDITFSISLANIVPAASAFTVMVNSTARTVSSVAISGTKVLLTLSGAVAYGDAVTVAYTKPSANPVQTAAGTQAASFSGQKVANNVGAVIPLYVSSVIENAAPAKLVMTYNMTLAAVVPAVSAFSVLVNSVSRSVSQVSVSGTNVTLTLSTPVIYGNVVTIAYTKPSSNPLQGSGGGQAASVTAQKVTNNVAAIPAPVYVSSAVSDAAPSKLVITYNLSLASTTPAASAFAVTVNSSARSVSSVAVSGPNVTLTLSAPVAYGDVVKVSYTKPSANPLQTPAGGQAASIQAQLVTNNVNDNNTPPVVEVSYKSAVYGGFVNEINASGSYDANDEDLTFSWTVPGNIPVSSTTGPDIQFLSPVTGESRKIEFVVNVSDGKSTQSKVVPIEILPYEPNLEVAEVTRVEASSYSGLNIPSNIIDGDIGTMWASNGDGQSLLLSLKEPFSVQHVKLAFQPGQKRESFFDILGSEDLVNWEPVLVKSNSCAFSGDLQVFDFPPAKATVEFRYIKLIGHGNASDAWNYLSEFRVFGYTHRNPSAYEKLPVKIYPNPAKDNFNVVIEAASIAHDYLRIVSLTGNILREVKLDPGRNEFIIPVEGLRRGIYVIQIGTKGMTSFSQKLVIYY